MTADARQAEVDVSRASESDAERVSATPLTINEAPDPGAWDAYVDRHQQACVYHRIGFRSAMVRAFGRRMHYFAAQRGEQLVGVLPLVQLKSLAFGNFMVSLPYVTYGGALADGDTERRALMHAAIDKARALGCSHVEFRDLSPIDGLPVRTDKVSMHLALPDDPDELFKAIGSKLRAQVRRPRKSGAESLIGGVELLDDFYAVVSRKYRDLGVPIYSKRWFRALLEWRPDTSSIAAVVLDGKIVAAGLLIGDRDRIEVPYAASVREADRLSVNMLLYWAMMEHAIAKGYRVFDFGRTTPDSGTHRFKRQWGAEPVQLYWHYWLAQGGEVPKLNADNSQFGLAVRAWRRLPLWAANLIGPRIVRNLP